MNLKLVSFFIVASLLTIPALADPIVGKASYYTYQSCRRDGTSGVFTASGQRFNENDLTCALRRYDFGHSYKVTNLENGKSVVVRHNDFGPGHGPTAKGVVIDLSRAAFEKIASTRQGIVRVRVEAV